MQLMKTQRAKTIKEWLEELPEPYRTQALLNIENRSRKNLIMSSLKNALNFAFDWDNSKEGFDYWAKLFLKIKRNESL